MMMMMVRSPMRYTSCARDAWKFRSPPKRSVLRQSRVLSPRRGSFRIVAFRDTDEIHDWRTKDMVSKVQTFFGEFVNKGNVGVIEDLFDDECVHVDMVWGSLYPSVGHVGMAHYLEDLRTTFPDFHIGVDNLKLAQASLTSLWVRLEGNCTGLGSYHDHKASGHANHFDAVVLFEFNKDRSKITHIEVFRTAFAEDREDLTTVVKEGGFRDLRLKRLMD